VNPDNARQLGATSMFDPVRKLGLIRDYADYLAAKQDLKILRSIGFDLGAEDFIYISDTEKHIELFESYLELDRSKPQPRDFLAYLMARVKKVTAETLEREAGVQDLGSILSGRRPPTGHEAHLLGQYFDLPPDDFVFNPVHRLGLIRDYADYGAAKQDIAILRSIEPDLPPEASAYISETEKHIELFERSLDLSRGKPQPRDLLAYLMKEVINVTTETVEREAGVRNLGTILSGDRPPTYDESRRLSRCFSVKLNAFEFEPRHQLGLIRDYADYLAARRDLEILRVGVRSQARGVPSVFPYFRYSIHFRYSKAH
jgi:antitoxin component HigA of HigAB toxin-antitoxin module